MSRGIALLVGTLALVWSGAAVAQSPTPLDPESARQSVEDLALLTADVEHRATQTNTAAAKDVDRLVTGLDSLAAQMRSGGDPKQARRTFREVNALRRLVIRRVAAGELEMTEEELAEAQALFDDLASYFEKTRPLTP